MNEYGNISALRIELMKCVGSPGKILKPFLPKNNVRHAWIPQTIGDQIWALVEFKTKEDRILWEKSLPNTISNWLDRGLIEHALSYGWHSRNMNGFIIN